jgi:hypothetical protein
MGEVTILPLVKYMSSPHDFFLVRLVHARHKGGHRQEAAGIATVK